MSFFRRKKEAKQEYLRFGYSVSNDRVLIELKGKVGELVAVRDWETVRPDTALAMQEVSREIEDILCQDETLGFSENSLSLPYDIVAGMSLEIASAFDLPNATNLALDISPSGRIDEDTFFIRSSWVRPGGQPVRVDVAGPFLKSAYGVHRIPQPLFSIYSACQALSQPVEKTERFLLLSGLREAWPYDASLAVHADSYLRDMRVHYASRLSIKLRELTPEHTDFDPVLFGASGIKDDEEPLDEDLHSILTPAMQKLFAEDRFRRERDIRPVYVLRDGEYVFVAPELRPVLGAIRTLQDQGEVERRALILNPRQKLQEMLGHSEKLEQLFVETEQFSERVHGVDIWRVIILPWLMPLEKNKWLPEKFGIKINDDYFVIAPENVSIITENVRAAFEKGDKTAIIPKVLEPVNPDVAAPEQLPVTAKTLEAFDAISGVANILLSQNSDTIAQTEVPVVREKLAEKVFLVVKENFEEVDFLSHEDEAEKSENYSFTPVTLPLRIKTELKNYQQEGVQWLADNISVKRAGVLLADDMGLGKTLQAIAFMVWLQEQAKAKNERLRPILIVAPTGLLGNWRAEISKHLDEQGLGRIVFAFGGDLKWLREESGISLKDIETGRASLDVENWKDAGVVLTTYETLRDYHFSFGRSRFSLVVYDEIQKIKNPVSQMARASKTLCADFVLGMTGTPVENRLQDLWAIMDVLSPGLLGASKEFERRYKPADVDALGELKQYLLDGQPAYVLRRMKSKHLDGLPSKKVHTYAMDMPPIQAEAYANAVARAIANKDANAIGKGGMLQFLALMRGISLHPLSPEHASLDLESYASDSARLLKTLEILEGIKSRNEKALVFLEDIKMQEKLAALIQQHFHMKRSPLRIHGGVSGLRRQQMVEDFQSNRSVFDVMILSPKAGGVGLTLTTANHVIHLSRWWNPAVEDQASDRVYRLGQEKDVHIHIPMAVHPFLDSSFDVRLNDLINRKRKLTQELFSPSEANDDDIDRLWNEVSQLKEKGDIRESENGKQVLRKVLSLPKGGDFCTRKWDIMPNQSRPHDEMFSCLSGVEIEHLKIRDPYAIASDEARDAQIKLMQLLMQKSRALKAVTIEYLEDDDLESIDARLFRRGFSAGFSQSGMRLQLNGLRRGRGVADFHDRVIEISVLNEKGAGLAIHTYDLGRGVVALFNHRYECKVFYTPPSK